MLDDIRRLRPNTVQDRLSSLSKGARVDLVVGGPPCQGWSKVGRGKLRSLGLQDPRRDPFSDPRNRLFRSFIRYTEYFRPRACVMENVPGMANFHGRDLTGVVAREIANLGYDLTVTRIDSDRLGVPQHRSRLLFVGLREDLGAGFTAPSSPPCEVELDRPVVRDAIGDLPRIPDGARRELVRYRPRSRPPEYARLLRPRWMDGQLDAHVTRWHRRQDIRAFGTLHQGGTYADLPQRFRRYRADIFRDKYRRLAWNEPSPCVTAHLSKDGYSHIHPSQARTISVREAARIQSFPDWYRLRGNMGERFRLLGNAVPPLAAYAVALAIKESLGEKASCSWHEFASMHRKKLAGILDA